MKNKEFKKPRLTQRFAARIVDAIIMELPILTIIYLFPNMESILGGSGLLGKIFVFAYLLITIAYYILTTWKNNGSTPGKMIAKIKVISIKGKLKFSQIVKRYLVLELYFLFAGLVASFVTTNTNYIDFIFYSIVVLFILFNKQQRGFHDLAAGTRVVKSE